MLTVIPQIRFLFVSHRHQFILFPDPLGACPWINRALEPWLDEKVAMKPGTSAGAPFFAGMSPAEAELAFDIHGYTFRNYTRVAVIRNPKAKMVQLYDRIYATTPVGRMRRSLGASAPNFDRWLAMTRPYGTGAAPFGGPRWRKFGAWSAENWCGDHLAHVIRAEYAEEELTTLFRGLGISPAFGGRALDALKLRQPVGSRFSVEARALIKERYAWDLSFYDRPQTSLKLVA